MNRRLAALMSLLLAAPAAAGSFSQADYGAPMGNRTPLTVTPGAPDSKALGFTVATDQRVHVVGGTAVSETPLSGDCGAVSNGTDSGSQTMIWEPRENMKGTRNKRRQYDCGYTGPIPAGTYVVKVKGSYANGLGPALVNGNKNDGAVGQAVTMVSATGPADDLRLSFTNIDATSAHVTATAVGGTGTFDVKFYQYNAPAAGVVPGSKKPILKTSSADTALGAIALVKGASYTVLVRSQGSSSGTTQGANSWKGNGTKPAGTGDSNANKPVVVLTVSASDDAASPPAASPDGGSGGIAHGGPTGGAGGPGSAAPPPPSNGEPGALNPTDQAGNKSRHKHGG